MHTKNGWGGGTKTKCIPFPGDFPLVEFNRSVFKNSAVAINDNNTEGRRGYGKSKQTQVGYILGI